MYVLWKQQYYLGFWRRVYLAQIVVADNWGLLVFEATQMQRASTLFKSQYVMNTALQKMENHEPDQ